MFVPLPTGNWPACPRIKTALPLITVQLHIEIIIMKNAIKDLASVQDLYVSDTMYYIVNLINPRGVMVKAMDCGTVVHEFVLQSRYYVHFRANTLGKGMNPLIFPAMG